MQEHAFGGDKCLSCKLCIDLFEAPQTPADVS